MSPNLTDMDLADLIRRMKGDRSYERLADASGGAISRQRWQQLGSKSSSPGLPDPRTLRTIADVLAVPERVVLLAAARTAGMDVEIGGSLADLLPPSVDRLSDTQVAAVLAVIRALLEVHDGPATKTDPLVDQLRAEAVDIVERRRSRGGGPANGGTRDNGRT